MTRVLVVGIGRSGTTWAGRVLGRAKGAEFLDEPDNHLRFPYAFGVKRRSRTRAYPVLASGQYAPEYEALWRHAFRADGRANSRLDRLRHRLATHLLRGPGPMRFNRGAALVRMGIHEPRYRRDVPRRLRWAEGLAPPQTPSAGAEHLVVKSVYALLSAEWIADRFQTRVLIVRRDLRQVLRSWNAHGWLEPWLPDVLEGVEPQVLTEFSERERIELPQRTASPIAGAAWLFGFLTHALKSLAARHPDWCVADYGELAADPHDGFPRVAARLGLEWTSDSTREIARSGRPKAPRSAKRRPPVSRTEEAELIRIIEPFHLAEWAGWT